MRGLGIFALAVVGVASVQAQNNVFVTVAATDSGATFFVDGGMYTGSAIFTWTTGSSHTLQAFSDRPTIIDTIPVTGQYSNLPKCYRTFTGWTVPSQQNSQSSDNTITVVASASMTIAANFTLNCPVILEFFDTPTYPYSCGQTPNPPPLAPANAPPGLVNAAMGLSSCYWSNTVAFVPVPSAVAMNAVAFPGWLLTGWQVNGVLAATGGTAAIPVNGPTVVQPLFTPAARVRFLTNPPGLSVIVDHNATQTIREANATATSACAASETLATPAPEIAGLCFGDFDFLPGSTHTVVVKTPQLDSNNNMWAFTTLSGPIENGAVTPQLGPAVAVTANFMPAIIVSLSTSPRDLMLNVDGVNQLGGGYWAENSVHTLAAPAQQRDANGKVWDFQSWSNGGPRAQQFTVPASATGGVQLNATYTFDPVASSQALLTLNSSPSGLTVEADGQSCTTPCSVVRALGATVRITAPPSQTSGPDTAYQFASWSDLGGADHTITLTTDTTVQANYQTEYRLSALVSPSSAAANFIITPPSSNGFYAAGVPVTVTARPGAGWRFGFWSGDVTGSSQTVQLSIQGPCHIMANLQNANDTPGLFVQNAVGVTPQADVAPGSLVSIFGSNLAPSLVIGPRNPLSQTLNGVAVTAGDFILPLMFVSPSQINALLPSGIDPGTYELVIQSGNGSTMQTSFNVARNAPGLLVNAMDTRTYAMALHADRTLITPNSPARSGETITVLGTGFGPLKNPFTDGFPAPQMPPNPLADTVQATVGGAVVTPVWSGAAAGYNGLDALELAIDGSIPKGVTLNLSVTVNGVSSNTVLLPVE